MLVAVVVSSMASPAGAQPAVQAQRDSISSMLRSPDLESIAQQQHKSFMNMVNSPELAGSAAAPTPGRVSLDSPVLKFGSDLRYGKSTVVSLEGEHVVLLIRAAATAKGAARAPLLAELMDLANKRVPEAQNFLGFAAENGAFGASLDLARALGFYRAAAAQGYQAAVYNLALASAYGRGTPTDFAGALALLDRAAGLAPEGSNRICGMASFLAYRQALRTQGLEEATNCHSALAVFPVERAETTGPTPQRLEAMRHAVATGTADAYQLLAVSTARQPAGDRQFLGCKYAIVNRYRQRIPQPEQLREFATRCVDAAMARSATTAPGQAGVEAMVRAQGIAGVSSFVTAEIPALNQLRKSNHFHYGAGVPYLPFAQQDADLFESVFSSAALAVATY